VFYCIIPFLVIVHSFKTPKALAKSTQEAEQPDLDYNQLYLNEMVKKPVHKGVLKLFQRRINQLDVLCKRVSSSADLYVKSGKCVKLDSASLKLALKNHLITPELTVVEGDKVQIKQGTIADGDEVGSDSDTESYANTSYCSEPITIIDV